MNTRLPRAHRKVNISLYADDIQYYVRRFGNGWTARVRDLVEADVKQRKERDDERKRRDLPAFPWTSDSAPGGTLGPQPAGPTDVQRPPDDDQE